MTKFSVGDRVRVKKFKERPDGWNSNGKMDHLMGEVVEIVNVWTNEPSYEIYDERYHRSWYVHDTQIEPVDEVIVVYRKGNRVIALDKFTGNKAEARCCPEDTFCFETGAKIAFGRLFAEPLFEPKPTYYNGKIIFIKGDHVFKPGHIYEIKNGLIICPNGDTFPLARNPRGPFKDLADVRDYFTAPAFRTNKPGWSDYTLEFIEVKE